MFMLKLKKTILIYSKLFHKFVLKVKKDQKSSTLEIRKKFWCKRKDHFCSSFAFRNNFMFNLKMSFLKRFDVTLV